MLLGQLAGQLLLDGLHATGLQDALHVVGQRDALEQPAHHVEDLVRLQLGPDHLQLLQQDAHDAALARLAGHQVDHVHRIVLLLVAVDAAHALLEPGGVPGDVVVDHQPAELQIDAFAGRCCSMPAGFSSSTSFAGRTPAKASRVVVASGCTFSLLAERIRSTIVRSAYGMWSEATCRALPALGHEGHDLVQQFGSANHTNRVGMPPS